MLATWFFAALVLLVAGERRLAEGHFNLRSSQLGIESDDTLDGDEIRVRLTVLNDDKPPALPDVSGAVTFHVVRTFGQRLQSLALGRPAPRGPPVLTPSFA